MLKKFRLWQLRRAYELVSKLEDLLGYPIEAQEMRGQFFRATWQRVDLAQNKSRSQRRRERRELVSGKR